MNRLLIRPGAIGDCLLCFPALEHLKAEYTEVWTPSVVVPLIQFADKVRSIVGTGLDLAGVGDLEIPAGLQRELRSFGSVVSWYGANRQEFRDALSRAGIGCEFHAALPPQGYRGHATDFFCRQVRAPAGAAPHIAVRAASPRNTVVIHPFSGSPRKNWPLDKFRELAYRLPCEVDWVCGPDEHLSCAMHFDNLAELASWMRGARLYIGNDSGITHLAAAAGCETIALFGPTDAAVWAPRGPNVTVIRSNPIAELPVDQVWTAVQDRMAGLKTRPFSG